MKVFGRLSGCGQQGRQVTLQRRWHHLLLRTLALDSVSLGQVGQKGGGRGECRRTTGTWQPRGVGPTKRSVMGNLKGYSSRRGWGGENERPQRHSVLASECPTPPKARAQCCPRRAPALRDLSSQRRCHLLIAWATLAGKADTAGSRMCN